MQAHKIIKLSFISLIFFLVFSGCYYDNKQELYPLASGTCDTSAIRFSKDIVPIMNQFCSMNGCHNSATHSSGWITDNYNDLKTCVNGGRFLGAIEWKTGFSTMPKGGVILSQCNLNKINAWINAKMPNN